MGRLWALAALLILGLAAPLAPVAAQTPQPSSEAATLVADQVEFGAGGGRVVARGNVEVFYKGRLLRAREIRYDQSSERIEIIGPITLIEDADTILIADQAALSRDLSAGILRGARLVLDQQMQIAATQIERSESGQFTDMYQTVASSCTICETRKTPTWQIRAKRVIHDTETRQLYFEEARLDLLGLPVAYLPRMRLPDPTVERSSGFLRPEIVGESALGVGAKLPFFWAIAPDRDLLLTPFVTSRDAYSLEARYRQAFANGWIELNGALSKDHTTRHATRSALFGEGQFDVGRDFDLSFNIAAASEDSYLRTYGISSADRLQSRVALTRIDRGRFDEAELIAFQSLRAADDNRLLPTVMTNSGTTRRFSPALLGGEAKWRLNAHSHYRQNSNPALGLPATASARDVVRVDGALDWGRSWIWQSGLVTRLEGALYGEVYEIRQDPLRFGDQRAARLTPYLGLEARLPLMRADAGGVSHRIEPMVQLVLAPNRRPATPNEDSILTEFDEANMFDFSRFTGRDTRELGSRVNIGLSYARSDAKGNALGATVARTLRIEDLAQFNPGSGLDGRASDWMVSAYYSLANRLRIDSRSLFDEQLTFAKSETFLSYTGPRVGVETGYTFLQADVSAGRPIDTSEWSADLRYDLGRDWTGRATWRYDVLSNDATEAGLGLTYLSECIRVDFDVERRFTSAGALRPSTSFGIKVALLGFGADDRGKGKGDKTSGGRACYF